MSDPSISGKAPELPHSIPAEQAVLGGLLLKTSAWSSIADVFRPDDYYRPDHRIIAHAIHVLISSGTPTDVVTVSEYLGGRGQLLDVGGLSYLGDLTDETPGIANIRSHAAIVVEKARLRRLCALSADVERAINDGATSDQVAAALSTTLNSLGNRGERRIGSTWLKEIGDYKPTAQILHGIIGAGSMIVIYGESNSGKTFLILDICMALALGLAWRQLRTLRGLVIYVAGEGAASVRGRLKAYVTTYPDTIDAPFLLIPTAVDLLDPLQVDSLISTIQAAEYESGEKAVLLVFDTLARAMAGGDESSTQDMGLAVAAGDRIRLKIGCAVTFIHHAGKDPTKGARGSSALRAACDTELLVEGQSGIRTVTVTKQRDLAYRDPIAFELRSVVIGQDLDTGEDITSCVLSHCDQPPQAAAAPASLRGKVQRQLVAALRVRTAGDLSRIWALSDLRQLGRELGVSRSSAKSAVDALVATPYMRPTIGGYLFVDGETK